MLRLSLLTLLLIAAPVQAQSKDGNRLAYLDELNLYYPSHAFPKLITPQWVGEKDVDAVVILAIDDMRDSKKYETYLRPILDRLKKIDGRAPVSIMACSADPKDPQLQTWLKEGLSIECHTFDHPCPFFKHGFKRAKETYEKCVDLMHDIPGNKPVAFRMPCCDSMNTPSPRFFAEIFNKTTDKKNFLTIDSSVFMAYTSKDPELPKDLVLDKDGKERFLEYFPRDRTFVNWIENYPYPYMIGRQCWQFPCMTPSDWQAQHRHKPFNPKTVEDWKAALDCTVIKKGVFTMVFHPHGWIKAEQVVELIDYAQEKYGKKVKFLTFKDAMERLEKNLFKAAPFRVLLDIFNIPGDPGHFMIDLDDNGYLDHVHLENGICHLWDRKNLQWKKLSSVRGESLRGFPAYHFGIFSKDGYASLLDLRFRIGGGWRFDGSRWEPEKKFGRSLTPIREFYEGGDNGGMLLDIDGDQISEVIYYHENPAVVQWTPGRGWTILPFKLPVDVEVPNYREGRSGLRFHDLNADGKLDLIFSNEKEYGIYLFTDMKTGWSKKVLAGKRGDKNELPMISRNGANNGFFIHSGHLWWSNEDTALLRDFVDRRKIADLLKR